MSSWAHVIVFVDKQSGQIVKAGIFSAFPVTGSFAHEQLEMFKVQAPSYERACREAIARLANHHAWAHRFFPGGTPK